MQSPSPVPVGGPGAAAHVPSSWRENSCDSDPEGGEQHGHRGTLISKHSSAPRQKSVNHGISLASAGGPGDKQHLRPWTRFGV